MKNSLYIDRQDNKAGSLKREDSISVAKAIGIVLMVVGHVYPKDSIGVHFIYCFHMPLFFFLSGCFFKEIQYLDDLKILVWKRIKRLYIPFLKWSFFFLVFHNLLLKIGIGWTNAYSSIGEAFRDALIIIITFGNQDPSILGFWFLKVLFLSSCFLGILTYSLKCFSFSVRFLLITILCLIITLIESKINLNNDTLHGMSFGVFFIYIGYFYRQKIKFRLKASQCIKMAVVFVGFLFVLSRIFDGSYNMELLNTDVESTLPFALTGCIGSVMIILFSSYMKTKMGGAFIFIGDNTLSILALHFPVICVWRSFSNISGWSNGILELCLGVCIPTLFAYIYNIGKIKLIANKK